MKPRGDQKMKDRSLPPLLLGATVGCVSTFGIMLTVFWLPNGISNSSCPMEKTEEQAQLQDSNIGSMQAAQMPLLHSTVYHHDMHTSPRETPGWDPAVLRPWQEARLKKWKRDRGLKIYIYDLPAHLQNCTDEADMWQYSLYGGEIRLPRLLRASSHVTQDPEEADYFYVPPIFFCLGTPKDAATIARETLQLIRQLPYWDRYGGVDHIWIYTQDQGYCQSEILGTLEDVYNSTILSHYGLLEPLPIPSCLVTDLLANFGSCPHLQRAKPTRPCFTPGKDFVIPHFCFERRMEHVDYRNVIPMYLPGPNLEPTFRRDREHKLFFAGGTRSKDPVALYSGGVRQTVNLLRDAPGIKFVTDYYRNTQDYIDDMQRSIFCLTPSGNGYGDRVKMAILNGCIPFVIQDNVQVEWEDLLPYKDFAVRIPRWLIWRLPGIVETLVADGPQVFAKQRNITGCVWRFFMWETPGRALEALICQLNRKLFPDIQPVLEWRSCTLRCTRP
eukprot:jgi/Botrbrau1/9037/Bobra.0376s0014.1